MREYIESRIGNEGTILIEVSNNKTAVGFGAHQSQEDKEKADNAFNQALNTIRLAANGVLETLNTLPEKPDHVKIDFAIKIDSDARAMLAKASSSDAQLKVSLAWRTPPPAKEKSKTKEE
ncbi:MAG TPA: hypothetical protein G4N96_12130 [Chloroflexi bacterium]|nr:MAG: hypothetical protein B6243_09765 [Anaerolineaceae bacterium 4572_5.2]HEY85845.1 hypothetical protein [Chloroflexota bacterium]